jgi:hypothetical protein
MSRRRARTRIGVAGLGAHNLDLLPALYRDAGTEVRWVRIAAAADPLARLATLLGFPLLTGEEEAVPVDWILTREAAPRLRRALGEGGIDWPALLAGETEHQEHERE